MNYFVWALLLSTVLVVRAQDYVDECPEENGFFADAVQCDRYYECKNGQVTLSQVVDLLNLVVKRGGKLFMGGQETLTRKSLIRHFNSFKDNRQSLCGRIGI